MKFVLYYIVLYCCIGVNLDRPALKNLNAKTSLRSIARDIGYRIHKAWM